MTRSELLRFMREHVLAVQTSVAADAAPQAALVGVVVTDDMEVFFDTAVSSRKTSARHSTKAPRISPLVLSCKG